MYFCVVLCIVCFVSFSVLFACVLIYCHRVATQFQLNISYHIKFRVRFAKVKFTLEKAMKAQRGSTGTAYPFFNLGARRRVGGQRHAPSALLPGRDTVPIVEGAGWVPQTVWTGAENLAPHRDSINRPTRSESLCRLSYPSGLRQF